MDSKLTRENLAELDAAAKQLDFHPVPPRDSALKLVEKLSEIKDVPLEVDDAKVAERIKQASENSGITFTDLARGCKVTDKVVWQWAATGKISKAKLPILARLCDVTVTWLLTGEEQSTLFAPTEDKFIQQREDGYVTSYYPILSTAEFWNEGSGYKDPKKLIKQFNLNPENNVMLAWIGHEDAAGRPKFAIVNDTDWYPPCKVGDIVAYATDIVPHAHDMTMIEKDGKILWGYLNPVGGSANHTIGRYQFDEIGTWRISELPLNQPQQSDVLVEGLKLENVIAVAVARWTQMIRGTVSSGDHWLNIRDKNLAERRRDD